MSYGVILQPNQRSRSEWAALISAAWNKTREGVVETGTGLVAAKEDPELPHGEFLAMVENDLPFGPRTAQCLMRIAQDQKLTNANHGSFLPPSWRTLYELTKLSDELFKTKIADGTIHPEMQRKDVSGENRLRRRKEDERRILSLTPADGKHRTLIIDPPWDYEWLSLAGRARPGYATMSHEKLLELPVGNWAEDDCHLYLWTTNNFITRAVELMAHWGFQHKTVLTWVKPRWGLGSYFRNSTEHVLFGVRGELRTRSDSIATHFEAPVSEHSAKPDRFYEIVREASYPPYGEAFQRAERAGFANLYRDAA